MSNYYILFLSPFIHFSRIVPVRVIPGLCLLSVSDPSVDGHFLQTPGQPNAALLRLGARHNGYGHQQVCVVHIVCICATMQKKQQ